MTKTKYDKKLLEEICNRDKCIIDFEKIGKYNRDKEIEFTCKCGNNYKKLLDYYINIVEHIVIYVQII